MSGPVFLDLVSGLLRAIRSDEDGSKNWASLATIIIQELLLARLSLLVL
jgi:hypothetical protein